MLFVQAQKATNVLRVETVTRADDPCAQKQELLGTQRIDEYLESQENGNLSPRVHCDDRSMSVHSWVRGDKDTEVTNDTWHASKNVAKEMCMYRTKAPRGKNLAPPTVRQSGQQQDAYVLGHEKLSAKCGPT